jgi:hypothetical protein
MKTKTSILICTLLISLSGICQDICSTYYPFKEGTKFQITNFDKKGKKQSVIDYEITNITNNVAKITTKIFDDKDKEITSTTYQITCDGNGLSIDFKSMMNPDLFKQFKDMDLDISGTNIEWPNNLKVGQTLKDAELNMTMNMAGMKMNMSINVVDRKVNAKESITTNAGTFDCFVLSYTTEMKMGMNQTFTAKEWISEGVGVVKSENYNKNGKLMGYSELTSFNK